MVKGQLFVMVQRFIQFHRDLEISGSTITSLIIQVVEEFNCRELILEITKSMAIPSPAAEIFLIPHREMELCWEAIHLPMYMITQLITVFLPEYFHWVLDWS